MIVTTLVVIHHEYKSDSATNAFKKFLKLALHLDFVYLMSRSGASALLKRCPLLLNGALTPMYLARALDRHRAMRRDAFLFHFIWISARVRVTFYKNLFDSKYILWKNGRNNDIYTISLSTDKKIRYEGEISLIFELNDVKLYEVCFSVARGSLVGSSAQQVLLVARVQGAKNQFDEIRRATKACHDIALPYLLVSAAKAVATALDIDVVAGIGNAEQVSKSPDDSTITFDYDAFWRSLSATPAACGFFELPVSSPGKPLEQVCPAHRRRARSRRQFKDTVSENVRVAFAAKCLKLQRCAGDLGLNGNSPPQCFGVGGG
ncbi:MAG: DUF535 family protein [Alphaproteobacteria bacterium]|nr:DUF535 family protein [Alphaproteobacteria bacterium]